MKIITNEKKIKMINVKNSVKTLGVQMSLSLSWIYEFEHVKNKMKSSIKKLMNVDMKLHQVCLYACFRCGIGYFNKKQCEKFKKINELPTIRKMRGDKFPRKLLHVKNQL